MAAWFAAGEPQTKLEMAIKNYSLTFKGKPVSAANVTALRGLQPFIFDSACSSAFAQAEMYYPELRDPTLLMRVGTACSAKAVSDAKARENFAFVMHSLRVARLTGDIPQDEKLSVSRVVGLDRYCEPIPDAQAFLTGIPHKNDEPKKKGQLWDVVRALASKKVHYRAQLKDAVWGGLGAASGAPFCEAYPDAVLGDGWNALTREALEATKIVNDDDYVKHILHKHDGEVRHWGARWWTQVPDDYVWVLTNVKFWHYQFAKTSDARRRLYWYHEQQWKGEPASGGDQSDPAGRGRRDHTAQA